MRVLLLSQYFYPEVGATQTRMYEFARHLADCGHDVTVLTEFPNHPRGIIPPEYRGRLFSQESRDGFTIVRVWVWATPRKNFRTRLLFYSSFTLLSFIRSLGLPRPEVVLATSPPLFCGLAGRLLAAMRRTRFVLDIRDLWPAAAVALGELGNPAIIRLAERVERHLYARADLITAVTRGFQRHIEELGIEPGKIKWIPNGTLPDVFKPVVSCAGLRAEAGMEGRFMVTFAGTQGIAQGLETIVEAAWLSREDPTIGFVLIGDGPCHQRLVSEAARRGLTNLYFKQQVPLRQITQLLNESDALLVPLRNDPVFETFVPSKLYDFMACAKPVLLGVRGEAASILEEAEAGLQYSPEDAESLMGAIRSLQAAGQERRRQMGIQGRNYVLRHFDRAVSASQLEQLLRELVRTPQ